MLKSIIGAAGGENSVCRFLGSSAPLAGKVSSATGGREGFHVPSAAGGENFDRKTSAAAERIMNTTCAFGLEGHKVHSDIQCRRRRKI